MIEPGNSTELRRSSAAGRALPAVWMLNRIAGVYLDIAVVVTVRVPDDYVASAHGYLDALDRGDGAAAAARITAYLDRHDAAMLGATP
jgi:hypothetical protein